MQRRRNGLDGWGGGGGGGGGGKPMLCVNMASVCSASIARPLKHLIYSKRLRCFLFCVVLH